MPDHTFPMPAQTCPTCAKPCDAATATDHDCRPTPGAIVCCGYCGAILQFGEALELEVMPSEAFDALPADLQAHLLNMQSAFRAAPMGRKPAEPRRAYAATLRKMALGAVAWIEEHGAVGLSFTLPADDGQLMYIAPLSGETIDLLAANETSRAFLRALDAATSQEATAAQVCMVVRAMELPVTDWSEDFCNALIERGRAFVRERGGKPS